MSTRGPRKKTILMTALALLWVAYVGIVSANYYQNVSARVDRTLQDRKKYVDFVLDLSGNMIIKDNIDALAERLKQAREFRMVDFYILQKKDKVVNFYNKQNNPEELSFGEAGNGQFAEQEDQTFKTIHIYDYTLTAGIIAPKKQLYRVAMGEEKYFFLHDILIATLFLGGLLYMVAKNALDFKKLYGDKEAPQPLPLKSVSMDKAAPKKHHSSHAGLSPAILHELHEKTPVPHSFESTVVRVDLTSATQRALETGKDMGDSLLGKYFMSLRELIARYGGLIHQTVGYEVVFHFKGPASVTAPMAASCVRSIFEMAEEMERTLPASFHGKFRVKAGLSSGSLHLSKLESGYSLTGVPFSVSAWLVGRAPEVSGNVLLLQDGSRKHLSSLCKVSDELEGHCTVLEFTSVEHCFAKGRVADCTYYRSDLNLMATLGHMEYLVKEQKEEPIFEIFKDLKDVKTHVICDELEEAFTHFLEVTYRQSHDKAVNPKILSAAVSLTHCLIPVGKASEKLNEILKLYLQFADPRVQANAVTVLGEMPSNLRFLKKFIHSDHNRVSADALVVSGKQVVDKELVDRVHGLLRSSDKVYQASGRYVALKLVEHYKENDSVYYNTNPHLKKLEELLGKAA